jgi:hypothetical protein
MAASPVEQGDLKSHIPNINYNSLIKTCSSALRNKNLKCPLYSQIIKCNSPQAKGAKTANSMDRNKVHTDVTE